MKKIKKLTILLLSIYLLIAPMFTNVIYANQTNEGQTPSGIPFSELEQEIEQLVNDHLGITTPGVAIAVVHNGEIVFSRGYGYANIDDAIPIDPESTTFDWGSTGKLFVWTSVMQLVERGLLDLDTTISTYLPEDLMNQFDFQFDFTMRDLMNHTAGFGENMLNAVKDPQTISEPVTLREALLMTQPRQIFEPSTTSAYSNFGTALAGYIVGYIANQEFSDFEMENILLPAGMIRTLNAPDWFGNAEFLQSNATGYDGPDNRGAFHEMVSFYMTAYPAGQLRGTVEDLARFAIALTPDLGTSGPLFDNPETLATLFSPSSPEVDRVSGTHHGFMSYSGIFPAFGHAGDATGMITNLAVVPEERFGFVIIANTAGITDPTSTRNDIRFDLERLLLGTEPTTPQLALENLPSATAVEGTFMRSRSFSGSFFELVDFIFVPSVNITAIDENTITLAMGNFGTSTFIQTAPYEYLRVESDNALIATLFGDEIRFRMEDGSPTLLHMRNANDHLPRSSFRSTASLVSSTIIVVVTLPFFLITPLVLLVSFLRNRKKGIKPSRFNKFNHGLLLCGTLLVLNNLISLVRILVINMFRTTSEMIPHVWINYVLVGLSALLFIGSLFALRKEEIKTRSKVFYVITTLFMALLIFVLHSWNFFVML